MLQRSIPLIPKLPSEILFIFFREMKFWLIGGKWLSSLSCEWQHKALHSGFLLPPLHYNCLDLSLICSKLYSLTGIWFVQSVQCSSVQSLSRVQLFVTPWTAARQASLSISNCRSPPKHMSTESVMPSNHLILCCPILLLPSIFASIRIFSSESALRMRWPKYWSFSFSISSSNEHPGLISFRMDWLDLLAVPGTLKSLLQHHSSKASILWRSSFFIVQL